MIRCQEQCLSYKGQGIAESHGCQCPEGTQRVNVEDTRETVMVASIVETGTGSSGIRISIP